MTAVVIARGIDAVCSKKPFARSHTITSYESSHPSLTVNHNLNLAVRVRTWMVGSNDGLFDAALPRKLHSDTRNHKVERHQICKFDGGAGELLILLYAK